MPRINLLPWREELRKKRKKEFLLGLLGAVMLGGLVSYGAKLTIQSWISNQNERNALLRAEIVELDKQIEEILGLENQKERLLARMEIIEQLQRARPQAQSSTRVSALMRNIDSSEWLRDPGLDVVQTVPTGPARSAQFTVFAQEISVTDDEEGTLQ
jgi:type IV pilus assembly protein PilN